MLFAFAIEDILSTTILGSPMRIDSVAFASSFNADAAQVFNESGADANFRIESDGLEYMFFVDAGNNNTICYI